MHTVTTTTVIKILNHSYLWSLLLIDRLVSLLKYLVAVNLLKATLNKHRRRSTFFLQVLQVFHQKTTCILQHSKWISISKDCLRIAKKNQLECMYLQAVLLLEGNHLLKFFMTIKRNLGLLQRSESWEKYLVVKDRNV